MFLLHGCALRTVTLERDGKVERKASGFVTSWATKEGYVRIEVELYRLALTRSELVVWLQPRNGTRVENLGSMALFAAGDLHTQYGVLKSQTRHVDFDVFITEDSADTRSPTQPGLLWATRIPR